MWVGAVLRSSAISCETDLNCALRAPHWRHATYAPYRGAVRRDGSNLDGTDDDFGRTPPAWARDSPLCPPSAPSFGEPAHTVLMFLGQSVAAGASWEVTSWALRNLFARRSAGTNLTSRDAIDAALRRLLMAAPAITREQVDVQGIENRADGIVEVTLRSVAPMPMLWGAPSHDTVRIEVRRQRHAISSRVVGTSR